ncbi:hypothetical protein [Rubellimicrobium rubrum]|uniref:hypothetical protein n=1 Tax=Rubellimicrobium rubrum TaxID=2585369 RepID=UPI00159BA051|nr:hypothetical protein [Rubellimicrobium rubrum]
MGEAKFVQVGTLILRVLRALSDKGDEGDPAVEGEVRAEVHGLCSAFPITAD